MNTKQDQTNEQRQGPIRVPAKVLKGLEAVRLDGAVNMLDRLGVQRRAYELERFETVIWIEENPGLYARAIFQGLEEEPSE
jgi:hypothetical protein